MKLTPLVYLAAARVPALVDTFSDALPIASMVVASGGLVTLAMTAGHGIAVGSTQGVAVVDALTPNAITALSLIAVASGPARVGDVLVTTTYPHNLTTTPDATNYTSWNAFATLSGIGVSALQGNVQLVEVPTHSTFIVRPASAVTLPGSVPSGAVLLERLERELIGWHCATATSKTVLTFPTPATVTRSFTVASPKVVKNIRAWGAVDLQHALSHFTRRDEADQTVLDQGFLFVVPLQQARLSRDRRAQTDALAGEITPTSDVRQMLIDGFEILVILPAERYGGAVACVDKCQGPIFTAMLKTFNGLKLPRSEIAMGNDYVAFLSDHGNVWYDRVRYIHSYRFESVAQLTNNDCVSPTDVPDVTALDLAIQSGASIPTDAILPGGSVPFGSIWFAPDPDGGIWQQDRPGALTAQFTI